MGSLTAAMTWAQIRASINRSESFYNVKDYGALGNDSQDDTTYIQAAINACWAGGGGTVFFPNGVYRISGALQTNVGGINYKSQLYIPQINYNITTRTTIKLLGETVPNPAQAGFIPFLQSLSGVVLHSTLVSTTPYSFLIGSIGAVGNWSSFNYNMTWIENFLIQLDPTGNKLSLGAIGFKAAPSSVIKNVYVVPYQVAGQSMIEPTNACIGIETSDLNGDNVNTLDNVAAMYLTHGISVSDWAVLRDTNVGGCTNGYTFKANYIPVVGNHLSGGNCKYVLNFEGGPSLVNILHLITENGPVAGNWYDPVALVNDPNNYGHGTIHYQYHKGGEVYPASLRNDLFNKSGGANLQYIPEGFVSGDSFTLTGSTDSEKLASVITVLKNLGLAK